jgi:hypothetical protein
MFGAPHASYTSEVFLSPQNLAFQHRIRVHNILLIDLDGVLRLLDRLWIAELLRLFDPQLWLYVPHRRRKFLKKLNIGLGVNVREILKHVVGSRHPTLPIACQRLASMFLFSLTRM